MDAFSKRVVLGADKYERKTKKICHLSLYPLTFSLLFFFYFSLISLVLLFTKYFSLAELIMMGLIKCIKIFIELTFK